MVPLKWCAAVRWVFLEAHCREVTGVVLLKLCACGLYVGLGWELRVGLEDYYREVTGVVPLKWYANVRKAGLEAHQREMTGVAPLKWYATVRGSL